MLLPSDFYVRKPEHLCELPVMRASEYPPTLATAQTKFIRAESTKCHPDMAERLHAMLFSLRRSYLSARDTQPQAKVSAWFVDTVGSEF